MGSTLVRNTICPGKDNNYLVGGNICNAFAIGELGSESDFFLVGAEPTDESNYPLLTGNILDSDGNVLFRLVKNMLVINPGNCSKIVSDRVGYEIHDGNDNLIFKVETLFQELPTVSTKTFVTTLSANFYNKKGELVFMAASGTSDERIESSVKGAYGFSGGFGIVQGYTDFEMESAKAILQSHGRIHKVLNGPLSNQEISLDGAALIKAEVTNCKILVSTGDFVLSDNTFDGCQFEFRDAAANVRNLALALHEAEQQQKKS